jgi:hypothetical protein
MAKVENTYRNDRLVKALIDLYEAYLAIKNLREEEKDCEIWDLLRRSESDIAMVHKKIRQIRKEPIDG